MEKLHGRRIALVGGAGFIGHHLALHLRRCGAEVFVIDSLVVNNYCSFQNLKSRDPNAQMYLRMLQERLELLNKNGISLIVTDARDYHLLCRELKEINPDTLIHLAAVAHAGKSNKDPYSTFDHSIRTLENALDNSRSSALSIKHFIYFSSSMVYGNFNGHAVTEETVCEPLGIYGALKFAGEKMVIAYNQVFDLPYTIIRPSALYGPRCVSRRVSQIFIENVMQDKPVKINGDGDSCLDFTFIDDLTDGIVCVLTNDNSINQTFNLTYGKAHSIGQMIDILNGYFPDMQVEYIPKDKYTPERGTLCIDKAREMLGYRPQFALEEGLERYIDWYREFMGTAHMPIGQGACL